MAPYFQEDRFAPRWVKHPTPLRPPPAYTTDPGSGAVMAINPTLRQALGQNAHDIVGIANSTLAGIALISLTHLRNAIREQVTAQLPFGLPYQVLITNQSLLSGTAEVAVFVGSSADALTLASSKPVLIPGVGGGEENFSGSVPTQILIRLPDGSVTRAPVIPPPRTVHREPGAGYLPRGRTTMLPASNQYDNAPGSRGNIASRTA
jgi:hypothetical protein